jgi:phage N-6-adenine-methyltransferase
MKIRPEAEIWPQMSDAELKSLAEDIRRDGQLDSIKLYQGEILDGRNRYLAMTKFCDPPLEPRFEEVEPSSLIRYVISYNEQRRHMNESQRGLTGALALPFFEAEAKTRRAHGKTGPGKRSVPIGTERSEPQRAADDAAKLFGTSSRNIGRGKAVATRGSDKLRAAVASGHLSLGKAEEIIKAFSTKAQQDNAVGHIAKSRAVTRAKSLTGEVEWYTPKKYIEAAVAVMGAIDLDPASSAAAQANVGAARFYTIKDDGITAPWAGRVFLNPPYAMPYVEQFASRMAKAYQEGEIEQGILLTNNATDTNWFHNAAAACSAICFTRGRISFMQSMNGELIEKTTPTHGQAFMYFGSDLSRFAEVFSAHGLVVIHHATPGEAEATEVPDAPQQVSNIAMVPSDIYDVAEVLCGRFTPYDLRLLRGWIDEFLEPQRVSG